MVLRVIVQWKSVLALQNNSVLMEQGNDQAADSVYAGIIPLTADDIADQIVYAATRSVVQSDGHAGVALQCHSVHI